MAQFSDIKLNQCWFKAVLLSLMCFSQPVISADISRDVREGREDESVHGGFLEIGVFYSHKDFPVPGTQDNIGGISVGGHYRFKRFFIDANAESYSQFQVGLNAYSGKDWSFDILLAASEFGAQSELNKTLEEFTNREPGTNIGMRATGYSGPLILQFEFMRDVTGAHGGHLATATIARQWLFHNWNFHALAGLRYESSDSLDYQFGLSESQATEEYLAYTAKAGTTAVVELGLTYPLNEYFIYKSTARYWRFPDSIADSPFITDDGYYALVNSMFFVY